MTLKPRSPVADICHVQRPTKGHKRRVVGMSQVRYQDALDAIERLASAVAGAELTADARDFALIRISDADTGTRTSVAVEFLFDKPRTAWRIAVRWPSGIMAPQTAVAVAELLTKTAQLAYRIESYLREVEVVR